MQVLQLMTIADQMLNISHHVHTTVMGVSLAR
jgi:ATP-dependent protease ClpP protease subunit